MTINYTFSYVVGGVTYTDGTGQLRVTVQPRSPVVARTLERSIACTAGNQSWNLDQPTTAADGVREADWTNFNVTSVSGAQRSGDTIRYSVDAIADCGSTKTINYTFDVVVDGANTTGTGTILLRIDAPVRARDLTRTVLCASGNQTWNLDRPTTTTDGVREATWTDFTVISVTGATESGDVITSNIVAPNDCDHSGPSRTRSPTPRAARPSTEPERSR